MREPWGTSEPPARSGRRRLPHRTRSDGVTWIPLGGHPRRLSRSTSLRSTARHFRRGQCGSVAIESALGITVLVISLSVVMEIVSAAYTSDRMSRAAALNPPTNQTEADDTACNGIIRELDLPTGFVCNTEWTIDIDTDLVPDDLPKTLDPGLGVVAGNGDMYRVHALPFRDSTQLPAQPA